MVLNMKTTSQIEWVTDMNPELHVFKLVAVAHDNGNRITVIAAWDGSKWEGDDGFKLPQNEIQVEAWADLPRFRPVSEPIQPKHPSPKPY
jgi:hypothetical protein